MTLNRLLSPIEHQALFALKESLLYDVEFVQEIFLFGSAARGEATDESDIDLLVLTSRPLSYNERHQITAATTDINLEYETTFSSLVVDRKAWEQGAISYLPIKANIEREGVPV